MLSGKVACGEYNIPVVDFKLLVNGTADQRSQAIRDLGRACEDWGFFMVINHGVHEALKEAVMKAFIEVLSFPEEETAEYLEAASMDPIQIGTGYYSATDEAQHLRHYLKMFVHPEFHCPAKPKKLRDVAAKFATQTRHLMQQLAMAISESLGLHDSRIPQALNIDSSIQMLAQNHYPAYTGTEGVATALPPHTDPGIFALIFQNGVDGLQVQHNGQWILATPVPGAFFVLAGDQLEIVTNERYRAVIHRAVIGHEQARTSVISMLAPCPDAVIEPV
ncbi:hypothetical protein PR202_gb13133 [Eleusine coracana subsp. coracana]|uniref:Fe2OG dioxygenase domain-containing protein n=1 Tax=Eleusine coracana subsp. coracana TaxID=191504 RepID=A0AAV5EPG9_ELECO|nr:hypothetical protein QOZ80_9BG0710920 [Eleusine coracana subsp. coracana]GJN25319.1 hypothetical protein PR202_gb13133 [Eleusine coracana subsp. coracana]